METTAKNKRGGRPKLDASKKRKYRVSVNLCTEDFYPLKRKVNDAGISLSEFARLAIIGCKIWQRFTSEQMDCIRKISGMANNLNQIARKANAAGYTDARTEYLYLAEKIDNELNSIHK